jgi:hypothetical protein
MPVTLFKKMRPSWGQAKPPSYTVAQRSLCGLDVDRRPWGQRIVTPGPSSWLEFASSTEHGAELGFRERPGAAPHLANSFTVRGTVIPGERAVGRVRDVPVLVGIRAAFSVLRL